MLWYHAHMSMLPALLQSSVQFDLTGNSLNPWNTVAIWNQM